MILGTAHAVGLGRRPRWYILMLVRKRDEYGNVAYVLTAHRDDGHQFVVFRIKEKLGIEDVNEMLDEVAKLIMRNDRIKIFEVLGGTGMLNMTYRRRAVWL